MPGSLEAIATCYNGTPSPCTNASKSMAITLPITEQTVAPTIGSVTSEVDTAFDSNGYGLPTTVKQYDWGTGAPGSLLRQTVSAYNYNTSCGSIPSGSSILGLPCTVTVENGAGTAVGETANTYDANGNLTQTVYGLPPTQVTTKASYNSNGTVATTTDVNSQVTTFAYNGTGGCSNAYPTSVTGPAPSSLMVSAQWDCYAGLATSVTDPNSKTTTLGYDNMNRLHNTGYSDGGSVTTTFNPPTQIQTTTKITSAVSRPDSTTLDGQGRVLAQIVKGVETDSTYDSSGRLYTVSILGSTQNDTYTYDAMSRLTKVAHADSSSVGTSYSNNCSTVTDESTKVRKMCQDGLGRTNQVIEDPSGLNYTTSYIYDPLNDLMEVSQGGQQICTVGTTQYSRCFQYDSLGRQTQVTTPEAGTVNYTYDTDSTCGTSTGDLVKRVDARSIRTCYSYDHTHRLTSTSYSDGTPTANYSYDQSNYNGLTISNGLGKQTGMSDGSGETAWSFDPLGRIVSQKKTISGVIESIGYSYNYDGSVATTTYPSGRVITYGVDSIGRPATAEDTANGINYVTGTCSGGACYYAQDGISSMVNGKTGSFAGITYSVGYNNRLMPSSISASSSNGTALSLLYGYFPNGNVQTITNNLNSGRTATYAYDSLNRINSASSQATSGSDCWGQTIPSGGYDSLGNLLTIVSSKCSSQPLSVGVSAHNQVNTGGFGYDASGDQTSYMTNNYTWDAEGRMKVGEGVTYTYDGEFGRVEDSSPTLFWYGLDGSVLAETNTSGNTLNEYIFFDGTQIARRDSSGNVNYYFGNLLGSATITTKTGSICYDSDFYPFGTEINYTSTCAQNYKFASMERDPTTGLDRTIFRQYASNYGRWMKPEPAGLAAVDPINPQTWNRYAYVTNNPTNFIDRLGLFMQPPPPPPTVVTSSYISGGCVYSYTLTFSYGPGAGINWGNPVLVFCFNFSGPSTGSCPPGVTCGSPPGAGGGGGGPIKYPSFWDDWRSEMKSCFVDAGLGTLADDLSPLPTDEAGPSDVGDVADGALNSLSNQKMIAAYGYAASKGLPYAAKSTIFQGIVSRASLLAKAADAIPIALLYYAIGDAYVEEWKECGW